MLEKRLIPLLLVDHGKLVKTKGFNKPVYVGDPVNAAIIFNYKEVDELILLDISATRFQQGPDPSLIRSVAEECFMPVCYGGGISTLQQIEMILKTGIEKVALNTTIYHHPQFLSEAAAVFGSQCLVASMDVARDRTGKYMVMHHSGTLLHSDSISEYVTLVQNLGAGEILLQDISKEGSWTGLDLNLIDQVVAASRIPVIASGGAGCLQHITEVFSNTDASGVAIGSMAVFQKKGKGVLINFPAINELFTSMQPIPQS
jgi:imidazole glycerol-phosphate synthase subunit HisF